MAIRIYRAPQIGSGTAADPYRSLLNSFIDPAAGDRFDEIDNPRSRHSICVVHARREVHDAIYGDRKANPGRIVYLTPLVDTEAEFDAIWQRPWKELPLAFRMKFLEAIAKDRIMSPTSFEAFPFWRVIKAISSIYRQEQRMAAGGFSYQEAAETFAGRTF